VSAVRQRARVVRRIFIHCTATRPSQEYGLKEARADHLARGWSDVGYHYIVRRDGTVEQGRPETVAGAHARGHNHDSLGVALEGGIDEEGRPDCNYTADQWGSLRALVVGIQSRHKIGWIGGHRDVDSTKKCPCFDARAWANGLTGG
jgi:N-acetyl-anhydromuramyl-L-alanine amidase AmpD